MQDCHPCRNRRKELQPDPRRLCRCRPRRRRRRGLCRTHDRNPPGTPETPGRKQRPHENHLQEHEGDGTVIEVVSDWWLVARKGVC